MIIRINAPSSINQSKCTDFVLKSLIDDVFFILSNGRHKEKTSGKRLGAPMVQQTG